MTLVKKPDFTAVNKTDSGTGNSESIDDTANDVPVNVTQIPIGQWNPTQLIGDTGNGTYPSSAYSLFGYS